MKTLRLYHQPCGRNLADVTQPLGNPDWTPDGLCVTPRPNVDQDDYRHPHTDADGEGHGYAYTYIWHCKCGAAPIEARHARIAGMWAQANDAHQAVVRLPIE